VVTPVIVVFDERLDLNRPGIVGGSNS